MMTYQKSRKIPERNCVTDLRELQKKKQMILIVFIREMYKRTLKRVH